MFYSWFTIRWISRDETNFTSNKNYSPTSVPQTLIRIYWYLIWSFVKFPPNILVLKCHNTNKHIGRLRINYPQSLYLLDFIRHLEVTQYQSVVKSFKKWSIAFIHRGMKFINITISRNINVLPRKSLATEVAHMNKYCTKAMFVYNKMTKTF